MISKKVKMNQLRERDRTLTPAYARRELNQTVPKYEMPDEGVRRTVVRCG